MGMTAFFEQTDYEFEKEKEDQKQTELLEYKFLYILLKIGDFLVNSQNPVISVVSKIFRVFEDSET